MMFRSMSPYASRVGQLLGADFCPGLNRYVYWLKTPLGVLIVAACVSLLGGVTVGSQGYVLFASCVSVIALGLAWPWIAIRCVDCRLAFPVERTTEGQPTQVALIVRNRLPFPIWGLAVERGLLLDNHDGSVAVALAQVPGWTRSEFRFEFTPPMRGRYPTTPPQVASEFPFGLWRCVKPIPVAGTLIAWPRRQACGAGTETGLSRDAVGELSDRQVGDQGDVVAVRPYRMGDQLRDVHWSLSARTDQLVVKERQGPGVCRARVCVDLDRDHHRGDGPDGSLESCVRLAAGLCQELLQRGLAVVLELGSVRIAMRQGLAGLTEAMDALALAKLQDAPAPARSTVAAACVSRGAPVLHGDSGFHDTVYWITTDLNLNPSKACRSIIVNVPVDHTRRTPAVARREPRYFGAESATQEQMYGVVLS